MMRNPSEDERRQVFQKFFTTLPNLPYKLYGARKQLLTAKLQTYESIKSDTNIPSSSQDSGKDMNADVNSAKSEKFDKSRSLRSGVNCKTLPPKDKKVEPVVMTQDGDKQCVRELRNFLRAALGELY
jgi:hypothetical protein